MRPALQNNRWGFIRKAWLLFTVVYFFMLIADFTSSDELYPHFIYVLFKPYTNFWNWIVPWAGQHIFHLSYPITVTPNGSGDTTYNYVLQFLWIVIAMIIALVWAAADHKRPSYQQLKYWARVVLRYYLAMTLFVYGFDKIIKIQFPFPSLFRLVEPYGDSSPMGLAWTFVGYSKGYNYFTGGAEVLAGCLLFFKRTTLAGALLSMAVMANIVAMNFTFDIPVKIFSTNLLVLSGWLVWYDIRRLINVFFLNKAAGVAHLGMPLKTPWKKVLQSSVKVLAIVFALYSTLGSALKMEKEYGEKAPKPPLYGIYDTELFIRKGDTIPPLATDSLRWKRIIINYPEHVRIIAMTDSVTNMQLRIDTIKKTASFRSFKDSTIGFNFSYHEAAPNQLLLNGSISHDSISIVMKRFDLNKFRLVNRGFNWINEYPYNR